ncbi:carboxymuconolactone decarboxylase family protein [Castellaniella sp. UC4442_H9]|jgi:AhpD family alkylhydroperoxidase
MNARLTLGLLSEEDAGEKGGELLRNVRKKQGRVPNMYAEMVHAPGALSTYLHGYDWFRKESSFTPAEQEVILLTISRENTCHYCIAAHSMIAEKVFNTPVDALFASYVLPAKE